MMPKFIESPRPTKVARPTGRVRVASELVTISGQKNSFQLRTKVKMATVASAGPESGRKMRHSRPKRLQSSRRPASSSATGMVRKNCIIRKTPKALAAAGTDRLK